MTLGKCLGLFGLLVFVLVGTALSLSHNESFNTSQAKFRAVMQKRVSPNILAPAAARTHESEIRKLNDAPVTLTPTQRICLHLTKNIRRAYNARRMRSDGFDTIMALDAAINTFSTSGGWNNCGHISVFKILIEEEEKEGGE